MKEGTNNAVFSRARDFLQKELEVVEEEIHEHPIIKFILVFALLFAYTFFTSIKFGAREGLLISFLTWSFFVLCTPIADAGILFDLPFRLITNIRMIYSELAVWIIAIAGNIFAYAKFHETYTETILLSLFDHILSQPIPYWGIIVLSGLGTFLSITFGDEILDISCQKKEERAHNKKHKFKHQMIIMASLIIIIIILYDFLLNSLGVHIPLM